MSAVDAGGADAGTARILEATPEAISEAADLLKQGRLVAFPTETVYGLGAAANQPAAVKRLFETKGRPADHPVIVHLGDASWLSAWAAEPPYAARQLAEAFWPGPLTLVLRRAEGVPDEVTGGAHTVGLRMPDHPVALALLRSFGNAVAAPSANRFGRISPTRAEHVAFDLGTDVDLILDGGPCQVGVESTIIDLSSGTPRLLRPGGVPLEAVEQLLGTRVGSAMDSTRDDAPRAPGTLPSHYAPSTITVAVPRATLADVAQVDDAVLAFGSDPTQGRATIVLPGDAVAAARGLYDALRRLDAAAATRILIEIPPDEPQWRTVRDRIFRAAAVR